jgi:hypothetical protein
MPAIDKQDLIGHAIVPWWFIRHPQVYRWYNGRPLEDLAPAAGEATLIRHEAILYPVRYREPGRPERVEWLPTEAYCLRALEHLCDHLCRSLRLEHRGGAWRIIASGQHGQEDICSTTHKREGGTLQSACEDVLGQLDPLWKR